MRAVWYDRKGPAAEVLHLGELPTPPPGAGEVRIKVAVAGLNPSDVKTRGGWGGDMTMPFPLIVPGNDGAGVIDAVGPGVAPGRVGERVWFYEAQRHRGFGATAEYCVLPDANAVRLPDGVPIEWGATLGVPAMTAHRCLFQDGPIAGQTVLVQGALGAVGHMAVQIAKWGGARVLATVGRPDQVPLAYLFGADEVLARREVDVAAQVLLLTGGRGVDRIVEVAFEQNLPVTMKVLAPNAVVSSYASDQPASTPAVPVYGLIFRDATLHFVYVYVMPEAAHADAARDITTMLAAGALRPHLGPRFAFDQAAAGHEAQESGKMSGKILIDVAP